MALALAWAGLLFVWPMNHFAGTFRGLLNILRNRIIVSSSIGHFGTESLSSVILCIPQETCVLAA